MLKMILVAFGLLALPLAGQELKLPAAAPVEPSGPVRISGGVIAGNILYKVYPQRSREAIEKRVNGAVVCHVIIGKDGTIKQISVISGPELLRPEYLAAIGQWVYKPYLLNRRPVEVDTTVTVSVSGGGGRYEPPAEVNVSPAQMERMLVRRVEPELPSGIEGEVRGSVVMKALISREGRVRELEVISGLPMLVEPALHAVRTWRYQPYLVNGEPVDVRTTIVVRFGARQD